MIDPATIRIFVGTAANDEDLESQAVLEHSLRKYASQPLDITWMKLSRDQNSFWYSNGHEGWQTRSWATAFSGLRWGIPAYCDYKGRAIYVDSDMISLADIAELWNAPLAPGKVMISKAPGSERFCTMLIDCAAIRLHMLDISTIRKEPGAHRVTRRHFAAHPELVQGFSLNANWNCLDGETYEDLADPRIKLLHYTSVPEQPHLPRALARLAAEGRKHWFEGPIRRHPSADVIALFEREYAEAMEAGFTLDRYRSPELFGDYKRGVVKNRTSIAAL